MQTQLNGNDRTRQDKAFMSLLVPNQRHIQAFILCLVPHKADAEDILQETLIEMWRKFISFEIGTDFVAWGVTIAKYKVLDFRRKNKDRRLQFNDQLINTLEKESDRKMKAIDDYTDKLRPCMQKLSVKEREFLRLRHRQDLTLEKISQRTGMSFQGVHKAIGRIHAKLVSCIKLSLLKEETK